MPSTKYISIFACIFLFSFSTWAQSCPQDENEFVDWFKKKINSLDTPLAIRPNYKQTDLPTTFREAEVCANKMKSGPTPLVKACLAPVKSLMPALIGDQELGIRRKDGKPFTASPLVLPRAFAKPDLRHALEDESVSQQELDGKLQELSAQLPRNAKIMQFQSATVRRRSVVTVLPSDKEDIYVHTHAGNEAYLAIRVNKKTAKGEPINPPQLDFFKVNGVTLGTKLETDRCISCHRSGSIAILPQDDKFISHTPGVSNDEMKKWWNTNRAVTMDRSAYSYDHLGPAIGPSMESNRTTAFVKECASQEVPDITPKRVEVIRNNMDCTSCHESARGETLMFPMHTWDFHLTILDNVILKGHMPMGSDDPASPTHITEPERKALLRCLKAEFFGGFTDTYFSQGNKKPGILLQYLIPSDCTKSAASAPTNSTTNPPVANPANSVK